MPPVANLKLSLKSGGLGSCDIRSIELSEESPVLSDHFKCCVVLPLGADS